MSELFNKLTTALRTSRWQSLFFYGVVAGAPALSAFLLTPILISALGAKGFATWVLVEPILMWGSAAALLGVQFGVLQRAAASPTLGLPLSALLVLLLTVPVVWLITSVALVPVLGLVLVFSLCASQLADGLASLLLNYYRGTAQIGRMASLEAGRQALIVAAIAALMAASLVFRSPTTVLGVRALATGFIVALLLPAALRFSPVATRQDTYNLLKYGFPIFISQTINIALVSGDRYIAALFHFDAHALTAYVAHQRVAGVLSLLVASPLGLWFPSIAMTRDPVKEPAAFARIGWLVTGALVMGVIVANAGSALLWPYVFPTIALNPMLLNIMILSVAFQCYGIIWNVGALRPGSTKLNIIPPVAGVAVLSIAGAVGAGLAGLLGLAAGRLIAQAVYAVMFERLSSKVVGRSTATWLQVLPVCLVCIIIAILMRMYFP